VEAESTAVEQLQNGLVRCAGDKCEGDEAFRQIFLIAHYNVKIGWMNGDDASNITEDYVDLFLIRMRYLKSARAWRQSRNSSIC